MRERLRDIPAFENRFLKSIVVAFLRRRKAICTRLDSVDMAGTIDLKGEVRFERLDLRMKLRANTRLTFTAWEDSMAWVWLGRRKKNAGWIFDISLHVDLWNVAAEDIVRRIEATMSLCPWEEKSSGAEEERSLIQVWTPTAKPAMGKKSRR